MRSLSFLPLFCLFLTTCTQKNTVENPLKVRKIMDFYKDSVKDFGIVALMDNGKLIDTASIGYAYSQHPVSAKNRFCIGSVTKMFTAVTVFKLQEKGLLTINDSIYRYLPAHPFIDRGISIKQLLNHTSGLTDFLKNGFQNAPFTHPESDFSDKALYARIDTVEFEKGTRYNYCNTNYFLLAKIIEKVTDKSWEMNIQELIIDPLQLKNTFPYYSNTIENMAHPMIDGVDLHAYPKFQCNILTQASGNIVSDVLDLNTFVRALLINKTLLSKKSLDQMTSFYQYKNTRSGLGIFEETHENRIVLGHTGRQISYITYAFIDPKTKESILVINNNANDDFIDKIFDKLCAKK